MPRLANTDDIDQAISMGCQHKKNKTFHSFIQSNQQYYEYGYLTGVRVGSIQLLSAKVAEETLLVKDHIFSR